MWLLLSLLSTIIAVAAPQDKLLVVSFDGFRCDYFKRGLTPNFEALKSKGSFIKRVMNVFPTQTFPNHFSIATGLYAENHGVLASEVFDPRRNQLLKVGPELFHYNEDVVPIWVLNQQNGAGRHSGVMMWIGSDWPYQGVTPTHSTKFNASVDWRTRVDQIISWFKHPLTPTNLVLAYFEEPDKDAHTFGPDSLQVNEQIKRADDIVKTLTDQLAKNGLSDVNLIFTSDHGMSTVNKNRTIYVGDIIRPLGNFYGFSSALQVYPHPGKEEALFHELESISISRKTFSVYKKADIPDRFRYKNCSRAPPILLLSKLQYAFEDALFNIDHAIEITGSKSQNPEFGVHGYDPAYPEMQPFLFAVGPLFKRNFIWSQGSTVDFFLLFADILGLNLPPYKLDGNFERISPILRKKRRELSPSMKAMVFGGLSVTLASLISVFYLSRCLKYRREAKEAAQYRELPTDESVVLELNDA